jgi:hypothetical protein
MKNNLEAGEVLYVLCDAQLRLCRVVADDDGLLEDEDLAPADPGLLERAASLVAARATANQKKTLSGDITLNHKMKDQVYIKKAPNII